MGRVASGPGGGLPTLEVERELWAGGARTVAGLDEVGRGAWAGPLVVAAAVPAAGNGESGLPAGVRDSKQISPVERERLYAAVAAACTDWAVGVVTAQECDALGMSAAQRLAARRALQSLARPPDAVLLDGKWDFVSAPPQDTQPGPSGAADSERRSACRPASEELFGDAGRNGQRRSGWAEDEEPGDEGPAFGGAVRTVVGGDSLCLSVAAASILAKVRRDRHMVSEADRYPAYDFDRNKGYPCPRHRAALAAWGPSGIHRVSWAFMQHLPTSEQRQPSTDHHPPGAAPTAQTLMFDAGSAYEENVTARFGR